MMRVGTITVAMSLLASMKLGDAAIVWTTPSGGDGDASEPENNAAAAAVVTVVATSSGQTIGDYTLVTTGSPFTLATSGALTVTAANTLDFETTPTYKLIIQVVDDAPSTSSATLTVSVTDANDDPVFSSNAYSACAADGLASGTSVATITATDQDTGDTLSYSITNGNTNSDFTNVAGEIRTANTLAMGTTDTYAIAFEVDDSTETATTTIFIEVKSSCSGATALVFSVLTTLTALVFTLN